MSKKTNVKVLTKEQKRKIRELVEVYYDYQDCRIGTSNRLAIKKDGKEQNKEFPQVPLKEIPEIVDILDNARDLENNISKLIKNELSRICTECGEALKGWKLESLTKRNILVTQPQCLVSLK